MKNEFIAYSSMEIALDPNRAGFIEVWRQAKARNASELKTQRVR